MFRKWAMQALAGPGIAYQVAYSSPSTAGVLAAVKAGLAVAPEGASIPLAGFRILSAGVLPGLPSAAISLHQSGRPVSEAHACLAKHIVIEFRSMPLIAALPHRVYSNKSA